MTQGRGQVIHADELTHYDFGGAGGHPMGGPNRVKWAIELARELGVMDQLDVIPPPPADDDLVRLVHTDDYIEAVKAELPNPPRYGLGTEDNPIFHGMHHVASQVVTATVAAARQVWTGQTKRVANISGGLHHAMPAATSGVLCLQRHRGRDPLAAAGGGRAHRVPRRGRPPCDGVQEIFYHDPNVLTISLHESPIHLFPGTGYASETGAKDARGSAVNVALPPHTTDAEWLRAFDAIVPDVIAAFGPEIIVSQHGCDSHRLDPLADLQLSVDGQRESYLMVADLADRYAGGGVGSPPEAAATAPTRWCRARGPICWRSWPDIRFRWIPRPRRLAGSAGGAGGAADHGRRPRCRLRIGGLGIQPPQQPVGPGDHRHPPRRFPPRVGPRSGLLILPPGSPPAVAPYTLEPLLSHSTRATHRRGGSRWFGACRNECLMSASEDKPENKGADKVAHLGDNLAGGVKFLTVAEVAAIMRVSKMSVYRLIHGGDLEAVRFGRSFRVPPETAVNDYLKGSYYDVG